MPEPNEEEEKLEKGTTSRVLEFFSSSAKETKREKLKPLTKIVIRRLPPRLTKDGFLTEFKLPPYDFFYFVRGDLSLGVHSFSRAYVNFQNPDDIFNFQEKYDDYLMSDEQGKEYHAVVEWAPVQRVPKKRSQKKMTLSGTIEADENYIEFLEKLQQEKSNTGNSSEYFMETESITTKEKKITTTPLLEFIKLKRQQKFELRNENRMKKREAEKERRRKEDEIRKEKVRQVKEKATVKVSEKDRDNDKNSEKKEKEAKESTKDKISTTSDSKHNIKPFATERVEGRTSRREERTERFEKSRTSEVNDAILSSKERDVESSESIKKDIGERTKTRPFVSRKPSKKADPRGVLSEEGKAEKTLNNENTIKEHDRSGETKSKFRYSEQRNRGREIRSQKCVPRAEESNKSLAKEIKEGREHEEEIALSDKVRRQSTQEASDGSGEGDDVKPRGTEPSSGHNRKDPRTERRIRNKDRPSIQIYRPGMGKFSKQRLEQKKEDQEPGNELEKKIDFVEGKNRQQRRKDTDIKPFTSMKKINVSSDTTETAALVNDETADISGISRNESQVIDNKPTITVVTAESNQSIPENDLKDEGSVLTGNDNKAEDVKCEGEVNIVV